MQVDECEEYALVRTGDAGGRYVPVVSSIGRLSFGANVHKTVYPWAAECVKRLGLEEEYIVVLRGRYRHKDAPHGNSPGKGEIWGAASQLKDVGVKAVFYAPHLGRQDSILVKRVETGETKEVNIIEVTILHELLHFRYPEKGEKWVGDRAYAVIFFGWDVLLE